ncbi:MAG: ABC transporter substrate-binding protein [Desulfobacterales bacterium]|nr:ABC transporter substrate-binding protein [Desulfobacterales bacterium]
MKVKYIRAAMMALGVYILCGIFIHGVAFATESYRLGVALALTGTGAPYCKEAMEGLELAVNEINAKGGLLGKHHIRLYIRDTQTNPETARKVVATLVENDRVQCVIGTYSSACALAIKPICQKFQILHIAPISNSENITKIDPSPYTYSVVPNTYMMSKATVMALAKIAQTKGWQKYVTIASDYAWGRSSQEIQIDLLRELAPEMSLLGAYWPRLGQTRFNSFIVDIMAQKPDFILSSIAGADNTYWMRDARDYRLFKEIELPGGLVSVTEMIQQAKSLRRGLYGRCRAPFFAHLDNTRMQAFVSSYRQKFNRYPSDWAVLLYDAVYILKQGIEAAQSIAIESVKEALKGATVDTTRGRFFFRSIDNQLSCSAYFGQVADDPNYSFPIYHQLMELKGPDLWRPEAEVLAARKK